MAWSILLLCCGLVLIGQAVGLRKVGREVFAPISVLGSAALFGVGSLLAAWITKTHFAGLARNPAPNQYASVLAVTGFLADAQKVGLIVAVTAALVAASTMVPFRRLGDDLSRPDGPTWRSIFLWLAAAALAGTVLLTVVDAVAVRSFIAALRPNARGDVTAIRATSLNTATMLAILILGGVVITFGAGLAGIVGIFLARRERASRGHAVASFLLVSLLGLCAIVAGLGHANAIRELRRLPELYARR